MVAQCTRCNKKFDSHVGGTTCPHCEAPICPICMEGINRFPHKLILCHICGKWFKNPFFEEGG